MTRLIHWIANVVRDTDADARVHFHAGPESTPAVCYDAECRSPRLEVNAD